MTRMEWKEFWEELQESATSKGYELYKVEANGGWRVLLLPEPKGAPAKEELEQDGILISGARYGFRADEGNDRYVSMLKVQWNVKEPVPFGLSKIRTVYVSEDPIAVFGMLYA